VPNGLKGTRLSLILAVLSKHARMPLYKVRARRRGAPCSCRLCGTAGARRF